MFNRSKYFIDYRNENLWNVLRKSRKISIKWSKNNEYSCYSRGNRSTIYAIKDDNCVSSFTHELLHIYLRTKEIYFGSSLYLLVRGNSEVSRFMSDSLIDHIGNCYDHIKILPIFLEMHLEREKFILDYWELKCTMDEATRLRDHFSNYYQLNPSEIDFFIGKVVGIFADPNESHNYTNQISLLKEADIDLYKIMEKSIYDWKMLSLEQNLMTGNHYRNISTNLVNDLNNWADRKHIA